MGFDLTTPPTTHRCVAEMGLGGWMSFFWFVFVTPALITGTLLIKLGVHPLTLVVRSAMSADSLPPDLERLVHTSPGEIERFRCHEKTLIL